MLVVDSIVSERILGLDLLQKNLCTIDLVQLGTAPADGTGFGHSKETVESKVKVQLIDNVFISARSEQEVLSRTQ